MYRHDCLDVERDDPSSTEYERKNMERPLIKHVERGIPFPMAAIIKTRPRQVASLNLWRSEPDELTAFSFDAGEGISKEVLDEDRLYIVVEGEMAIELDGTRQALHCGDCVCVPAHMEHSLDVMTPGKALLITVG
jgi:Cupin domain.